MHAQETRRWRNAEKHDSDDAKVSRRGLQGMTQRHHQQTTTSSEDGAGVELGTIEFPWWMAEAKKKRKNKKKQNKKQNPTSSYPRQTAISSRVTIRSQKAKLPESRIQCSGPSGGQSRAWDMIEDMGRSCPPGRTRLALCSSKSKMESTRTTITAQQIKEHSVHYFQILHPTNGPRQPGCACKDNTYTKQTNKACNKEHQVTRI